MSIFFESKGHKSENSLKYFSNTGNKVFSKISVIFKISTPMLKGVIFELKKNDFIFCKMIMWCVIIALILLYVYANFTIESRRDFVKEFYNNYNKQYGETLKLLPISKLNRNHNLCRLIIAEFITYIAQTRETMTVAEFIQLISPPLNDHSQKIINRASGVVGVKLLHQHIHLNMKFSPARLHLAKTALLSGYMEWSEYFIV